MAIAASLARLGADFISLIHTRAELATVEVEEEALRYFTYLLMALSALFFMALAVILAVMLVVVLFWDEHRVAVLLGAIVFFVGCSVYLSTHIRTAFRQKPPLLGNTLTELARDIDAMRPSL